MLPHFDQPFLHLCCPLGPYSGPGPACCFVVAISKVPSLTPPCRCVVGYCPGLDTLFFFFRRMSGAWISVSLPQSVHLSLSVYLSSSFLFPLCFAPRESKTPYCVSLLIWLFRPEAERERREDRQGIHYNSARTDHQCEGASRVSAPHESTQISANMVVCV